MFELPCSVNLVLRFEFQPVFPPFSGTSALLLDARRSLYAAFQLLVSTDSYDMLTIP